MLSAVLCRPTALLVRLTFKESWNADNNPTTSCCEKTFRMVTKCFDTALVILAAIALREHTHTLHRAQAITITYSAFFHIGLNFPLLFVMKSPFFPLGTTTFA